MHLCIKCGALFKGKPEDILKGCPDCGSHFFEYYNEGKETAKKEKPQGESIETVMVHDHGIYELDLPSLLEDDSIIVSDEEGTYVIDINFLFKKKMNGKGNI